ncbi:dTDP-4-dehydrorhamnose reductase [Shewanella waksmanii]|uniref:dTDP-4-dehydrorhamnose reductase n=1 Tax=Shewanella waksmanii TaxID=213783 RepID=UPI00048AF120|nr:dTDP-4-dehydrorhamnose reductase [Shewanella waksmanii]
MKVLVIGKNGQLGFELAKLTPSSVRATFLDSNQLDVADMNSLDEKVSYERPEVIINCAAYTAVDKAEAEQYAAYLVNLTGCENLAKVCKKFNCKLIHVSTDFVFSGQKSTPYLTTDKPAPTSIYGKSKLAGELAIQRILPTNNLVIRTSGLYSVHGDNFVKTMLGLFRSKDMLNIVVDQVASPTWARGFAEVLWQLANSPEKIDGTLLHWTDAGVASKYDFAVAIQSIALKYGMLETAIPISPILGDSFPTPASRPNYSVLDQGDIETLTGTRRVHWQLQLERMLVSLKNQTRVKDGK